MNTITENPLDTELDDPYPDLPHPDLPKQRRSRVKGNGQMLPVNEGAYTVEGEGANVGRPYTFIRFKGCNLRCKFCDTDHSFGKERTVEQIVEEVQQHPADWVCMTGGEPLLQNLVPLCEELHGQGYRIHVETNGTVPPEPKLFDLVEYWTVSPKRKHIVQGFKRVDELKYVVGKTFREEDVEEDRARQIFLQPESSDPTNLWRAMDILRRHPTWRLSLRIHTPTN